MRVLRHGRPGGIRSVCTPNVWAWRLPTFSEAARCCGCRLWGASTSALEVRSWVACRPAACRLRRGAQSDKPFPVAWTRPFIVLCRIFDGEPGPRRLKTLLYQVAVWLTHGA